MPDFIMAAIFEYVMSDPDLTNLKALSYFIYGLHLFSAITGLLSSAFIITAFLSGWPSILAVILNYVKRGDVEGTYLASHFRWQIRTFWFGLLWFLIAALFAITVVGIPVAIPIAIIVGVWIFYRMIRGILKLIDSQPLPS